MLLTDQSLQKILQTNGLLVDDALNESQANAQSQGVSLYSYLLANAKVNRKQLGQSVAEKYQMPYIELENHKIPPNILEIIPEVVAKKEYAIAFKRDENGLHVAVNRDGMDDFLSRIEKKQGVKIIPYFADEESFHAAFTQFKHDNSEDGDGFHQFIKEILKRHESDGDLGEFPLVKIVNELLLYAHKNRSSDIHVEPQEYKTVIRFRIDGILHDIVDFPKELHELIVARIKIMARLRTDEHNAAQDGKLRFAGPEKKVDVRVSIVPLVYGEKIVMRLLSEKSRQFDLEKIGFNKHDVKIVMRAIKNPWGMILVTGPTGSGKSTTLYGILKRLNTREINISTIEDPVEYDIEGINQIQVNPRTNLTFASGLRSLLRQDPDIIMVGEIRDEETAKIAINSAMTGHLVLSTLHTNESSTAIPRLLDMGIESFLAASTINVVIAQRLVRKLCDTCKVKGVIDNDLREIISQQLSKEILNAYKLDDTKTQVYSPQGCTACDSTGYKGRIGIFEVVGMTDEIKHLVMKRSSAGAIKEAAIEGGMTTMIQDGIEKVLAGITSIMEIIRVAKE